jgi:transposase
MPMLHVGIDWGSDAHRVCVLTNDGTVMHNRAVRHDRDGLAGLLKLLTSRAAPDEVRIAIERPSGLLVDTLIDAGFTVVPIHPNAVKASRARYRAALTKSDREDAYLLADLLRTDGHRFRAVTPRSDEMRAIRRLARVRTDLVKQRVMLTNQLAALLQASWPGAEQLFADLHTPIALAFLERYPAPRDARGLGVKRMQAFLARNRYSGRRSARDLVAHLKTAPQSLERPIEAEASREAVLAMVAILKAVTARLKDVTSALEHTSADTAMGRLVLSFPRMGPKNGAKLVAELGDEPARFLTRDHLAAEGGVVPVTRASGKRHAVAFRYACNKDLRNALTTFANNSRAASPWAQAIYEKARARGCRHPHATRILARAWSRVLYACWTNGTPYDPSRHATPNRATG